MKTRKKVIILGGGLSGLAAGEKLSKEFEVEVFEAESYLGGLASTFKKDDKDIPKYYHHIVRSNKYTLGFLKRFLLLNSLSELKWKKIKVAIGVNKKISIINKPLELLKFNYLSLYEKLRFGLFGIYSLFMNPNKIPEGRDAESWLNKYAGKSVTRKIFHPLYAENKFNIPLSRISASQFANRLAEKEIGDFFTYPSQSYKPMIEGLAEVIRDNKGKIKTDSRVSKIDVREKYIIESGKKIKYDILINTIPFESFIKISNLPKDFKEQLSKIKYCPAVNVCFGTEDFLKEDVYWINLFKERIHIIMQHSVLFDGYGDKINWCLRYGGSEEDLDLNEEEIKEKYLEVVRDYFPKAKIKWARVFKSRYAEPVYDINYHKYVPDYKTPIRGLYFAGIQLSYPRIRNMDAALESGVKVADVILKENV